MLAVFMEHKLLSSIFIILLLLSIICQIMIGVIYQKMIKETDNMSSTSNKLLRQCKLKFANCYKLNAGVSNIPVFVDKFIGKVSFMGIALSNIQHLSGQLMLLSVVAAGIGACREIINGETVGRVLPYYIVSFLGLYVYFSISGLVDLQGKKEKLKTNLVDYLENHMVNKLRQSEIDWAEITGGQGTNPAYAAGKEMQDRENAGRKQGEKPDEEKKDVRKLREEIGLSARRKEAESGMKRGVEEKYAEEDSDTKSKAAFSPQEEEELEELLREFFA